MQWAVEGCTVALLLGTNIGKYGVLPLPRSCTFHCRAETGAQCGASAGAIIQIGQSASTAVNSQWPDKAAWWTDNNGFWPMVIFTVRHRPCPALPLPCPAPCPAPTYWTPAPCLQLGGILPLSMLPTMRQLEVVGAVGSIIVWVLTVVIMVKSISNGLPQLGK